jgi:hypothetical protein
MERIVQGDDENGSTAARANRGLRLDTLIAVCALLISSLASAASWWQARLLGEQTRVLQEQLGAQVWPYVGVSDTIDNATVAITMQNNGLGPAVVRSLTAAVDGRRQTSMIGVLHAVLGSHLIARAPHGEHMRLAMNGGTAGSVLRPGDSTEILSLTSKTYARPLMLGVNRVTLQICYCAIVPGQCWFVDSEASDPQPVPACSEIRNDLLHASPFEALMPDY